MSKRDKFKVPDFKRYKYSKSPIQEALIEVKFNYENFDVTVPGQFFGRVKSRFPIKKDLQHFTVVIGTSGLKGQSSQERPSQVPQMQVWAQDETRLLQLGPGLLTVNTVRYAGWEHFLPDFEYGYDAYIDVLSGASPSRIGVRYINRFPLEFDEVILSQYFKFGFTVPDALHGSGGFQVVFDNDSFRVPGVADFKLRVRFGTDARKPGEMGVPVILDIDCFTEEISSPTRDAVLKIITAAHEITEYTFESSITDTTRKILEGTQL